MTSPRSLLVLLASARRDGNACLLARRAVEGLGPSGRVHIDWADLATLPLPAFRDPRPGVPKPPTDVLGDLAARLIRATDVVFAVPVYWYALPAPAKLFIDHWSGFLDTPDLNFATAMKGKRLWLLTARADADPQVAMPMEDSLRRTGDWLGMNWCGALHGVGDAKGDIVSCESWSRAPGFLALP